MTDCTDRELVRELCRRLGLTRATGEWIDSLGWDEYAESDTEIVLGEGGGYTGFRATFSFDGDRLVRHSVVE